MCKQHVDRSLIDWLTTQKNVLALWRDGILEVSSADIGLVESLDTHHNWLSDVLARMETLKNENVHKPTSELGCVSQMPATLYFSNTGKKKI